MLDPQQIYLIFAILGAVCGAMLWIGYFRRIDILEHERIIDVIIALVIGFFTPTLALWIYYGLEIIGFNFNGFCTGGEIQIIGPDKTSEQLTLLKTSCEVKTNVSTK